MAVLWAGWPGTAGADVLDAALGNARAVGRAGATMLSDDGAGALLRNPAALARRSELRFQVGAILRRTQSHLRASDRQIVEHGAPQTRPTVALAGGVGDRLVLGASWLPALALRRQLPEPAFDEDPLQVEARYPHRHGGMTLHQERSLALAGAAWRLGDAVGIGLALGLGRTRLREQRIAWLGRDPTQPRPLREYVLDLDGERLALAAAAGVLVAPPSLPLELGIAADLGAAQELRGRAELRPLRSEQNLVQAGAPTSLALPAQLTVRAGLRYLGERAIVELGAELEETPGANEPAHWRIDTLQVADETGATATLDGVAALRAPSQRVALRGAVDVELIRGFLWLTTGYAWKSAASDRLWAAAGEPASHTVAAGIEGQWDGIALQLGYARSLSRTAAASPPELIAPFAAPAPGAPLGVRRHQDAVALAVEIAWP
jgi:hypothetical protein